MSSTEKNLSLYNLERVPDAKLMHFGLVVSDYNEEITEALKEGAIQTLKEKGASEKNIFIKYVPGSFELIYGAKLFIDYSDVDAVICLGCVIQGETRHFEFICNTVADKIGQLNLESDVPIIFGVLTTNTKEQALERAGGKLGNKGVEAAIAAIRMVALRGAMEEEFED